MTLENDLDRTWIGQLARIDFLDHCNSSQVPVRCSIFGVIDKVTDETVVARYWVADIEGNDEYICLIRQAITGITKLGAIE